jgi:hypothetical protein
MNESKDPFPGLRVPKPPEVLRGRVFSKARAALQNESRRDLWARIWESRQARLAWGTSILALAVGHFMVPAGETGPATEPSKLASTESHYSEELADISNLPRLSLDALSITDSIGDSGEDETDEENRS